VRKHPTKGRINQQIDKTMENEKDLEKEVVIDDTLIEDEDLKKNLQTVVAQKKHYREKYQKVNSEYEEYKKTHPDTQTIEKKEDKPVTQPTETKASSDDIETVLEMRAKGYSDSELLTLRKYAKRMSVPISEIADDPLIKSAIEVERQKAKVEQNTPTPSSGTQTVKGKTWAQMSSDERKANYETFIKGGGSNSNI
jgi:preprotein translocase subunit SecD